MKWLRSTNEKAWTVALDNKQVLIPGSDKGWLELDDSQYHELEARPVIKSLIKAGDIYVASRKPTELTETVPELKNDNAALTMQVATLKQELADTKAKAEADLKAVQEKAEADLKAVQEKADADLKEAQEKADADLKALDEKATAIVAEKDALIQKLEKQLKKSGDKE